MDDMKETDWVNSSKAATAFWLAIESDPARALRRLMGKIFGRDIFYGDRRNYDFAQGRRPSSRIALVNHLIRVNGYRSYLEIGVRDKNAMFENIDCEVTTSVDPDPAAKADYPIPSDEFFETNRDQFDIVFIDGNHTGDQVERDILNSLSSLAPNGVILLHDMNPPSAFHARADYEVDGRRPSWNGTSWKGFARLRKVRDDLEMHVVDTDWGVGVVRPGKQKVTESPVETYADLKNNRKDILNLISVADFLRLYSAPFAEKSKV